MLRVRWLCGLAARGRGVDAGLLPKRVNIEPCVVMNYDDFYVIFSILWILDICTMLCLYIFIAKLNSNIICI